MPTLKPVKWLACFLSVALLGCSELTTHTPAEPTVKNVILIIGDGMGPQQVGLLLSYARQAPHSIIANHRTALDRLLDQGQLGISLTYPDNALVTDSAASATQLATGKFAGSEMLGLDKDGNPQINIIEQAKRLGKATGLVSDTRITHATPAAFAAHQTHRSQENDIAEDLLAVEPDVMLSGGFSNWIPEQATHKQEPVHQQLEQLIEHSFPVKSERKDNKNLLYTAQQKNYTLAFNTAQLQHARGKTLGLFAGSGMADGIAENQNKNAPKRTEPTLKEMSEKALEILDHNPKGFFLMIESGQIDWACHRNDTGLLLHEMLRFNDTLNAVLDWVKNRNDTLVIVTADHETGGFGFSYSNANLPVGRKLPGKAFAGGTLFKPHYNFGAPAILDKLYAQQRSYHNIFAEFDALPTAQKTPRALAELVNRYTLFTITETEATTILKTQVNPNDQPDKPASAKAIPVMPVNDAFYMSNMEKRENLLGQAVSSKQSTVWATGTHTSTPVYVFTLGPKYLAEQFRKILHHTELGQLAINALQCSGSNAACPSTHHTTNVVE
ncbi:Alkaline phosphatase [Crenothrix polyspora]|uniref:Alkaline phosphatase n=1 Tax=Crenothrix polyspora TaxID=360316 RepID=A0A1R4GZB7_9GAMM|nr:alkaline phosphatase [Crenothrix polyspora]SJM89302.1 Alkaline phosphatase [Crenothrix polyspora]